MLVRVDSEGTEIAQHTASRINADLSISTDAAGASAERLLANEGLCSVGFSLFSTGFVLEPAEAERLRGDGSNRWFLRRYFAAKDLTDRDRGEYVIDFGLLDYEAALKAPMLLDIVRDRVKPERDANRRNAYRVWSGRTVERGTGKGDIGKGENS